MTLKAIKDNPVDGEAIPIRPSHKHTVTRVLVVPATPGPGVQKGFGYYSRRDLVLTIRAFNAGQAVFLANRECERMTVEAWEHVPEQWGLPWKPSNHNKAPKSWLEVELPPSTPPYTRAIG